MCVYFDLPTAPSPTTTHFMACIVNNQKLTEAAADLLIQEIRFFLSLCVLC